MYLLFKHKGILPSEYYWKPAGEKMIIRAFLEKEIEEKEKEKEELFKLFNP
ncbi:MAG: hypothetical protein ACPLRZ_07625 [Thermovenabulum sp.]|uniref:hypothetical protein n=1 Tax=Thermovenabulum sp. TaxID=3100335 RepID=UPI003C7A46D3